MKNPSILLIKQTPSYLDILLIAVDGGGYILAVDCFWWLLVNIFWLLVGGGG